MQLAAATSRGPVLLHDHWTLRPVDSISTVHGGSSSSICSSKAINIHTPFSLLCETRYTSTWSIFLNSITFAFLFLFKNFDMQATHLRICLWSCYVYLCYSEVSGGQGWIIYTLKLKPSRDGFIYTMDLFPQGRQCCAMCNDLSEWSTCLFTTLNVCVQFVVWMWLYCMLRISAASLLLQGLLRCHGYVILI